MENSLPIQCLQRHEKCVNALALWKDTLYSGSEDSEIKVSIAPLQKTHISLCVCMCLTAHVKL